MHGEAQKVMENLRRSHWWKNFELEVFVLSTFDSFRTDIRNSSQHNVATVYFGGHCGEGGKLVFNKDETAMEMEMLGPDFVVPCIARASKGVSNQKGGGTIECGVFNACFTRSLGKALREGGMMNVVCWHGKVKDSTGKRFAEEFFQVLNASPTDYKGAFEAGQLEVKRCDPAAAGRLCFFSDDFNVDVADEVLQSSGGADADEHGTGDGHGTGSGGPAGKKEDMGVDCDVDEEHTRLANAPK